MTKAMTARRGLTLVELLVAVAISGFVLAAVFSVLTTSSRTFRIQSDVASSMDRLNFAMDTIKADMRRTGYLAVPNDSIASYANATRVCPNSAFRAGLGGPLHALRWWDGGSEYQPGRVDQVMIGSAPDRLQMLGAFRTDGSWSIGSAPSGGSNLSVERRDGASNSTAQRAFEGAILALQAPSGGVQFLRMQTGDNTVEDDPVSASRILARATDAVQGTSGDGSDICRFESIANQNLTVTPLHFVRYTVRQDRNQESTLLVREEVAWDGTVLDSYIVARNVVDFQVWFDRDGAGVGVAPAIDVDDDSGARDMTDDLGSMPTSWLSGSALAQPELARYAYIQLSVRLDTPVPNLGIGNDDDGLRRAVEIIEFTGDRWSRTGENTRVLTMRAEVELTNISLTDL
jgi:prepilin-type N-terminal cleavage/methylation domain-containing protein